MRKETQVGNLGTRMRFGCSRPEVGVFNCFSGLSPSAVLPWLNPKLQDAERYHMITGTRDERNRSLYSAHFRMGRSSGF